MEMEIKFKFEGHECDKEYLRFKKGMEEEWSLENTKIEIMGKTFEGRLQLDTRETTYDRCYPVYKEKWFFLGQQIPDKYSLENIILRFLEESCLMGVCVPYNVLKEYLDSLPKFKYPDEEILFTLWYLEEKGKIGIDTKHSKTDKSLENIEGIIPK